MGQGDGMGNGSGMGAGQMGHIHYQLRMVLRFTVA